MSKLVQIYARDLHADRIPRGTEPFFEMILSDNERIVKFEVSNTDWFSSTRKTVDHTAKVWVACEMEVPA